LAKEAIAKETQRENAKMNVFVLFITKTD